MLLVYKHDTRGRVLCSFHNLAIFDLICALGYRAQGRIQDFQMGGSTKGASEARQKMFGDHARFSFKSRPFY